jgi:hypothetical protein
LTDEIDSVYTQQEVLATINGNLFALPAAGWRLV